MLTSHATTTSPAAAHPAYTPTPSIPLLITELAHEEFWARYAKLRGDAEHFAPAISPPASGQRSCCAP